MNFISYILSLLASVNSQKFTNPPATPVHWWHAERQIKIKRGSTLALQSKIRSAGCHVERVLLPQFPVWSVSSLLNVSFPIFEDAARRPCTTSGRVNVCAFERTLWCQACQMGSCPLEEFQTMRSIRAQLNNWRSKPSTWCCHGNAGCRFSTSLAVISLEAFFK